MKTAEGFSLDSFCSPERRCIPLLLISAPGVFVCVANTNFIDQLMRRVLMISKTIRILIVLMMFVGAFAYAPAVGADDIQETQGFRKAVTLAGIREHQAAFQSIANAN